MKYCFQLVLLVSLCLSIDLIGQEAPYYELAGLEIKGCNHTDAYAIQQMSGLRVGDKLQLQGTTISQVAKRLLSQQLFQDVQVEKIRTETDLVWLEITVVEAALVTEIKVLGLGRRKTTEWTEWLKTQHPLETAWLPAHQIQLEAAIRRQLQGQAYAEDAFQIYTAPNEDTSAVSLTVVFDVLQKKKLKALHLDGVKAFKVRELKQAIGLGFWRKPPFNPEWKTQARAALLMQYRDKGYLDAVISRDSSWQEAGKWHWALTVDESVPYTIGKISWKGAHQYDPAFLQSVLGVEEGDPYRPEYLERRLHFDPKGVDVSGLYMDNGHLFFQAEAIVTSLNGTSVDIEIRLSEGPVAIIREVKIEGNERTNEHVIRRELRTQPGQAFSRAEILRSQHAIINLGYFKPEHLGIKTKVDPETGMVDITYEVEEERNDKFELSASLNPGSENGIGVVGTLGFTFNNFSLKELFNGNWRSPYGDGQQVSIRAQSSGPAFQAYNFNVLEPWFLGKPKSLGFSLFHQRFTDQDSLENLQTLSVSGANLRLGQRLPWGDGGWTLSSELGYQHIRLNKLLEIDLDNGEVIDKGQFHNLYAQLKLAFNTIADPFYPRQGSRFEVIGQWTPPWQQTYGPEGTADFNRLAYHKYRVQGEKYIPLGKRAVLKTSAKMGWLLNYQSGHTPPFERFELGGNGMTGSQQAAFVGNDLLSLRGYELDQIPGSRGGGGAAFAKFTTELRYPLFQTAAAKGYILGFAEAGNSWKSVRDFNVFDTYRSAGVGMRFQLPMFGTIGFDYGLGLDQGGFQLRDWQKYGTFNLILGWEPE